MTKFLDETGLSYYNGKIDTKLSTKADSSSLSTVATSGSYNDLTNKPTIPTKTSQLTNDSGYKTTDNNTTYTFATGDSDGQIKITPSNGTAQNVSVKSLNTAAYRNVKATVSAKSHTDYNNNQNYLPSMNFLTYWNGAYNSSNSSNLTYAHQGTIQCKPTNLYNNTSGTTGNVTLSDNFTNYDRIVIYYQQYQGYTTSTEFKVGHGTTVTLNAGSFVNSNYYDDTKQVTFSGKNVTAIQYGILKCTGSTTKASENNIKITRIDGYK